MVAGTALRERVDWERKLGEPGRDDMAGDAARGGALLSDALGGGGSDDMAG